MIKEKFVVAKASGRNINFIRKILEDVKFGDVVTIGTSSLWRNSHIIITAVCDICHRERKMTFQEYSDYIEKSESYYCKSCFNKNIMPQKMMDKYGVNNFTKTVEYKILSENNRVQLHYLSKIVESISISHFLAISILFVLSLI